ncbi:MAG: PAS domain S-box protein [Elusimicrobiales bacterium]|jgi:PAS domain S-box-containing protein
MGGDQKYDAAVRPDFETRFREIHGILQKESFRSIAKLAYETAAQFIGCNSGYMAIINPAGGKPEISLWNPSLNKYTNSSSLPPCMEGIIGNRAEFSEPLYYNDLSGRPGTGPSGAGGAGEYGNLMIIPLVMGGCTLGYISLAGKPDGFTDADAAKARGVSRLVAIAIAKNISLEMLSAREKNYRDLFEHAGGPIAINDLRGRFLDVNKKTCEILRYEKGELLGKNVRDILTPDSAVELSEHLEKLKKTGETVFEAAGLRKNGELVDIELVARVFEYFGRKAILTVAKDISERKKREDFARHDTDRLGSLRNIYTYPAQSTKDLLDYVMDEAIKLTSSRAGSVYLYYYDDNKMDFVLDSWARDIEKNTCVIIKPPLVAPQKTGIWGEALITRKLILTNGKNTAPGNPVDFLEQGDKSFRCMAIPVFISERNAAVIGLANKAEPYTDSDARQLNLLIDSVWEVLRRKKSEEELAENRNLLNSIINSMPGSVTAKGISGHYSLVNLGACGLLRRKMEEIIGKSDAEIFPPEKARRQRESDNKVLTEGKMETSEEDVYLNGKKRSILFIKAPLLACDGKVTGVLSIGQDITDRKQMQAELVEAQKAESLGILAGGIAHDFNNMLTVVLGNTSLALEQLPPRSRQAKMLGNALKAAKASQELTHQLLTFAKGAKTVNRVFELQPVIKEAAAFACTGGKIKYIFDLNPNTPPVKGDEGQIKQVINNLVINARQAMQNGGTISVKTAAVTINEKIVPRLEPGSYARILVCDTGSGIPRRHLGRIFDPYFSTKKTGRGLGLAMAASIIQNHGGHIGVISKEGEGTMFVIYLPAASRRGVRRIKRATPLRTGKGRILLMDDDKMVLEVLSLLLKRLGYSTRTTADGKEAIKAYIRAAREQRPYSAVIMDLTIPGGMGGDEAAACLKDIDPNVRLIASSGYSENSIMARDSRRRFDAVLPKPYRIQEVGEILAKVMAPASGKTVP